MKIPNNPAKAYLAGQKVGHKNTTMLVATVLRDKIGFHVREETEDERDTMSIKYFWDCRDELADEVRSGRIKLKDIEQMLMDEENMRITE